VLNIIVQFIGIIIAMIGILAIRSPQLVRGAIRQVEEAGWLRAVAIAKLLAGIVLLVAAASSRLPTLARLLGGVMAIGAGWALLDGTRLTTLAQFGQRQRTLAMRLYGSLAMFVGSFLVYASR
jgi:hypothetical protein